MEFLKLGPHVIRLDSIDEMRVGSYGEDVTLHTRSGQWTFGGPEAAALVELLAPGPATGRRLGQTIDITPRPGDPASAFDRVERERDTLLAALESIVAFTPTWPNPTGVGPEEQILQFVKTTVARAMAACHAPATAE